MVLDNIGISSICLRKACCSKAHRNDYLSNRIVSHPFTGARKCCHSKGWFQIYPCVSHVAVYSSIVIQRSCRGMLPLHHSCSADIKSGSWATEFAKQPRNYESVALYHALRDWYTPLTIMRIWLSAIVVAILIGFSRHHEPTWWPPRPLHHDCYVWYTTPVPAVLQ